MTTILTLTKIRSGFANVAATFELGARPDLDSHLALTLNYSLPDGFTVAESAMAGPQVYGPDGTHYDIVEHSSGHPQLIGAGRLMPVLLPAEAKK